MTVPTPDSQVEGHTFICYSRRDAEFVVDLAAGLKKRGCRVWLDQWNLGPGDDWDQAIDAALATCAALLIVLSPDAVSSGEVRGELRSALNQKKHIVPVLYRACAVPRQLQNTQYLDASETGEQTETLVDDLARALRRDPGARSDRWRDVGKAWAPVTYLGARLKALGASAAGGVALLAVTGLLAESSYARLIGIHASLSAFTVLSSGFSFFITLLLEAIVITIPAGALVLLLYGLGRAARTSSAAMAVVVRWKRVLARPGFLWAAQIAVYLFLFFFSLPVFASLLPLTDVAFNQGLLAARIDSLRLAGRHYTMAVLYVGSATVMVAGLEAWRRRLHWKRYHLDRSQELVSLGLALPLYFLVAAELLLLPIGHGLLRLPALREYYTSTVAFRAAASNMDLRGKTFLLMDLRPAAPYRFYCPQGSKVFEVGDEDVESFTTHPKETLAGLLEGFRKLKECRVASGTPEEVAR